MGWITLGFALALAVTTYASRKRPDALTASAVFVAMFIVTNGMNAAGLPFATAAMVNVALDWVAAVGFVIAWRVVWPPRNWLFGVALLSLAQVMAHWAAHLEEPGAGYRLVLTCNVLFAVQLLTVVIGPRIGQIATYARGAVFGADGPRRRRVRGGGVVDAFAARVGGAELRKARR